MTIFFIVSFIVLIAVTCFCVGSEVESIRNSKAEEKLFVSLLHEESDKDDVRMKHKTIRAMSWQAITMGGFGLLILGFALGANIWDYREQGMSDLMTGKRVAEEVVITKTKTGCEPQADTTYNFHLVKPEKK